MFRKPRAGHAEASDTFDRFLTSRWTEHATRAQHDSILSMRRHRMRRIGAFLSSCAHTERVVFSDFAQSPVRRMEAWARAYNLTNSGHRCAVSPMLRESFLSAHRMLVQTATNESCDGCCWTAQRAVENYVQAMHRDQD